MADQARIYCQHCEAVYRVDVGPSPDARPVCPKCGSPTVMPVGHVPRAPFGRLTIASAAVLALCATAVAFLVLGPAGHRPAADKPRQGDPLPSSLTLPLPAVESSTPSRRPKPPPPPPVETKRPEAPPAPKAPKPKPFRQPTRRPPRGASSPPPAPVASEGWQGRLEAAEQRRDWRALENAGDEALATKHPQRALEAYRRAFDLMEDEAAAIASRRRALAQKLSSATSEAPAVRGFHSISHLSPDKQIQAINNSFMDIYGINVCERLSFEKGKLVGLDLSRFGGKVRSLRALRSMPLKRLNCSRTAVTSLNGLQRVPLAELDCSDTPVEELAPLKGLGLRVLNLRSTKVRDLTPLAGMPLRVLHPPPRKQLTLASLELLDTLEKQGCKIVWEK